jgi:hypothetical protein
MVHARISSAIDELSGAVPDLASSALVKMMTLSLSSVYVDKFGALD